MLIQRHVIFGTAGHVDHGKSALVLALTGTDPDRLAEEKAREMTIDLGFAFLSLPGIEDQVAIVDVPGHEMFVRNMVAGATGVDAAILVVAADEGVMPQTVEHLEVLRQLGVSAGVVALTKVDRAAPEQAGRVTEEVRELLRGSALAEVAILPVSSVTREGLPELREALAEVARGVKTKSAEGVFRLPIDRAFTLRGVGTVVTGTVISGSLEVGDRVNLLPQNRELRTRYLHVHGEAVRRAFAGQRAAVNLADIAKDGLGRGDVLATPGSLAASHMVDARLNLSATAPRALEQRTRVRVHHGTKEVMARVVLLEGDALEPGESGLVQLRLESALVPTSGDVLVVRSYTPVVVIGGGTIVDPHPPKRRGTRGAAEVAERESLPVEDLVLGMLERAGARGEEAGRVRVQCSLTEDGLRSALEEMREGGRVFEGRKGRWYSASAIEEMKSAVVARLGKLHAMEPLKMFAPLNAVAGHVAPSPEERECFRLALDALAKDGVVAAAGEQVRLGGHAPQWGEREGAARDRILRRCLESGLAVPSPAELAADAGMGEQECGEVLEALVNAGELHALAKGIYVHPAAIAECRARVQGYLEEHGTMTVGECRELLGASRRYLLPFLEQLDGEGVTVRQGNHRVLAGRR